MRSVQNRSKSDSSCEFSGDDIDPEESVGWNANVDFDRYAKNKNLDASRICRLANSKVPLSTVIGKYVTLDNSNQFKKWSDSIRCPFPDHRDTNPSFAYNHTDDRFSCLGCQRSGGSVQFLAALEKRSQLEIAKDLLCRDSPEQIILEIEESRIDTSDEVLFEFADYIYRFHKRHVGNAKALLLSDSLVRPLNIYLERNYMRGTISSEVVEACIAELKSYFEAFDKYEVK